MKRALVTAVQIAINAGILWLVFRDPQKRAEMGAALSPANPLWLLLGGGLAFLITSFVITGFHLVHKLPARFPGRNKLAELALAYNHYGRSWRTTLGAFVLSILAHGGYWGTFYCASLSFARPGMTLP